MGVIKALFFDLDDTLHDFRQASGESMDRVYSKITHEYGIDKELLKGRYAELLKQAEERAFLDGRSSTDYRLERFCNLLQFFGIRDDILANDLVRIYGEELEKRMKLFPEVLPVLDALQKSYDLYVVTEGPVDAQRRTIQILGLEGYFKGIFISGGVRKAKSSGELFNHAILESGHFPQEAMLIGDSYQRDVVGGMKAGLRVIWLNRENKPAGEGPKPSIEIRDFTELQSVLRMLARPVIAEHHMQTASCSSAPIMVLGHPRSGTNFVSAVLQSHPSVNILVEPFSQHCGFFSDNDSLYWKAGDFDPDFFHERMRNMPEAVSFLKDFRRWLHFDSDELRVFKETTFFLQLEWLKEYLPGLRVIYIERRPPGVIASFKKSDFFNRWDYSRRFRMLAEQVNTHEELKEYRAMVAEAGEKSWIDQLYVMWHIRTCETRKALRHFDHAIFSYEALARNPKSEFSRMFGFAGLEFTDSVIQTILERTRESKGGEFSTFRDSKRTTENWKRILDNEEKRTIRKRMKHLIGDPKHEKRRRTIR